MFCSIHSIDREKLVLKLSKYPEKIKNIDEFFIQVNLADEVQKSGVSIKSFDKLLIEANKFLKINGLMCLPPKIMIHQYILVFYIKWREKIISRI